MVGRISLVHDDGLCSRAAARTILRSEEVSPSQNGDEILARLKKIPSTYRTQEAELLKVQAMKFRFLLMSIGVR
jgi:hypothetical protein